MRGIDLMRTPTPHTPVPAASLRLDTLLFPTSSPNQHRRYQCAHGTAGSHLRHPTKVEKVVCDRGQSSIATRSAGNNSNLTWTRAIDLSNAIWNISHAKDASSSLSMFQMLPDSKTQSIAEITVIQARDKVTYFTTCALSTWSWSCSPAYLTPVAESIIYRVP